MPFDKLDGIEYRDSFEAKISFIRNKKRHNVAVINTSFREGEVDAVLCLCVSACVCARERLSTCYCD